MALENPYRQLMPIPPLRRPVTSARLTESPVAAFQLSFTAMLCWSGVPRLEPRFPGQHGLVVQLAPSMVPSTNVVWATDPGNTPKIGAGTPVVTWRRKLSYRSAFVMLDEQFARSAANGGMHWIT